MPEVRERRNGEFVFNEYRVSTRKDEKFLGMYDDDWAYLVVLVVKNLPANAGDGFDPWVRKIPWRSAWKPTTVFLAGETMDR